MTMFPSELRTFAFATSHVSLPLFLMLLERFLLRRVVSCSSVDDDWLVTKVSGWHGNNCCRGRTAIRLDVGG